MTCVANKFLTGIRRAVCGIALLLLAILVITGCKSFDTNHRCRSLSFPHIQLDDGERIDSIEIKMACGRFVAIDRIPDDWSVDMVGPSSEISTLKESAGHGSSALWHVEDLNDTIFIMDCSDDCFDISVTFKISVSDKERTVSFSKNEIIMTRQIRCP